MITTDTANGWSNKTLRDLTTINYGKSPKEILSEDGQYPVVGTGGAERSGISFLYDGESIVLGRKGTIEKVYFATGRFWTIDTAYYLSDFNGSLPRWLYYVLQNMDLRQLNEATGVPSLSRDRLYQIEIAKPPKAEQSKIAEILSTVDRAIEQTEGLISKQQRIKTGLIQDLLTHGMDEQGNLRTEETHQFKDSALGRIPVEWEVVKVKEIAKIVTGDKDTQDRDDAAPYLFFVRSQTVERIASYSFDGEAVLTAGDGVGTGKVFHYINGKFDFHQRVYCMHSFSDDMEGYFFFHYFQANFIARVAQFSAKGSVDSVRMAMIAEMLIPKPREAEQMRSAQILHKAEQLESDYTVQLDKLRSLKTALMQDLLTGDKRVTPLLDPTVTN
jgi:type I restriction enzyme, S subunit